MNKFKLEDYTGKYVMHCNTWPKAEQFITKYWHKTTNLKYHRVESWYMHNKGEQLCFTFNNEYDYNMPEKYKKEKFTILEFDDFDWSKKEEKEMKEFKVGDYVSSKCFDGTKKISEIHCDFAITSDWCMCYLKDLKLVCEFTKGQEILVSNGDINFIKKEFYSYDSNLERPYIAKNKNNDIHNWKNAKPLLKYKPYTEPKLEWLEDGKQIVFKATEIVTHICGIRVSGAKYVLQFGGIHDLPLEECYEKIEWLDGTPFGEEV